MEFVEVDSPLGEELSAHSDASEGFYSWPHGASGFSDRYPILEPKMREEVSMSFWVPV